MPRVEDDIENHLAASNILSVLAAAFSSQMLLAASCPSFVNLHLDICRCFYPKQLTTSEVQGKRNMYLSKIGYLM